MSLIRADARELDWAFELAGRKINCILTDPPYGVNYTSFRSVTRESVELHRGIAADKNLDDASRTFLEVMLPLVEHAADECEMYVFTSYYVMDSWKELLGQLEPFGFVRKMMLIWDKGDLALGDIDGGWNPSYEIIYYLKRGRRDVNLQRPSVLRFDRPKPADRIHPMEKPVPLLTELLRVSTYEGDLVVDPFAGSGSSLVAAQRMNRQFLGTEADPKFFEVASRRLEQRSLLL